MTATIRRTVAFPGISVERLKSMLGAYNGHLKQIEQRLEVSIAHRGDSFYVDGELDAVERAEIAATPVTSLPSEIILDDLDFDKY